MFTLVYNPGGQLLYEGGYRPHKKNSSTRVVFQEQTMYMRTSLRGAKYAKLGNKAVFLAMFTNIG